MPLGLISSKPFVRVVVAAGGGRLDKGGERTSVVDVSSSPPWVACGVLCVVAKKRGTIQNGEQKTLDQYKWWRSQDVWLVERRGRGKMPRKPRHMWNHPFR